MRATFTRPVRSLRRRLNYLQIHRDASRDPILLFAMGRTGTTALGEAMQQATGRPVHKLHRMSKQGIHRLRTELRPPGAPILHRHLVGHYWRRRLRVDSTRRDVITAMREPVAHTISRFFQVAPLLGIIESEPDPDQPLAPLVEALEALVRRSADFDFFADELGPSLGIDVYARPFEAPATTFVTDRFRLFVFRFEELAQVAAGPLPIFLGSPGPIELRQVHGSAQLPYARLYRRFCEEAVLPEWFVDLVYERRDARHFYTPSELASFRRRWSRR